MHSPQPISVLVVDDEPDLVDTCVTLLALHGFRAAGALDGRRAIESAAADPPDVALVDLSMPGVDGFEVAHQLRAGDHPPVLVAVTGLKSDWDRQRAHDAGFALYLVKPVAPEELVTIVRQCGQARGWE